MISFIILYFLEKEEAALNDQAFFHRESTSAKHYANDKRLEVHSFYMTVHILWENAIK